MDENTITKKYNIYYGLDEQRIKTVLSLPPGGSLMGATTRYYFGAYEKDIDRIGNATQTDYIYTPAGLTAMVKGGTLYYIHTDNLGSIQAITDESRTVISSYYYTPWGARVLLSGVNITDRGYTFHEHLEAFCLINMNGRVYDPMLARFLSPDPYVQMPDYTQNFNRYSYCLNNPFKYTDPSGEFLFTLAALIAAPFTGGASLSLLPYAVGADIGMWQGGSLANGGEMNPTKWDFSSGKTWGYMLGGAVVGGVSGYLGAEVAAGGGAMANTAGIMTNSFVNSAGTYIYTGGQTDISISFGFGSYNFSTGEFGYLGKKGNSALENIGYAFGAMANVQDGFSLIRGGGQNVKVNSASTKDDWWGHSSITDADNKTLVSVGPPETDPVVTSVINPDGTRQKLPPSQIWKNSIKKANTDWPSHINENGTWSIQLNNVSTKAISSYMTGVTRWDLLLNSCVGHTTRALWSAGIPTIYLFHPIMLNLQLTVRQIGIYSSSYLYQIP